MNIEKEITDIEAYLTEPQKEIALGPSPTKLQNEIDGMVEAIYNRIQWILDRNHAKERSKTVSQIKTRVRVQLEKVQEDLWQLRALLMKEYER